MSGLQSASSRLQWGRGAERREWLMNYGSPGGPDCPGVHTQLMDTAQDLGDKTGQRVMFALEDNVPGVYTEAPMCLRLPQHSATQWGPGWFLQSVQYGLQDTFP